MSLRLGRWQDVLDPDAELAPDALLFDAPFSAQTHAAETTRSDSSEAEGLTPDYSAFTEEQVREFCESRLVQRTRGWIVSVTDSVLAPAWRAEFARVGRYAFAPVVAYIPGMSVRIQGDGPSSWALYVVVARPRNAEFAQWGTLPGGYKGSNEAHGRSGGSSRGGGRGKPGWLMQALVRDYTKKGDLVCDPFMGWGTTALACEALGRRFVGSEMDAEAYAEATKRLARPLQVDMFGGAA